ncbi:unnamed protein product [Aphanomyces euteiches]
MQHESSTAATAEEDRSHGFDCNICLDHVKEPVVTLCGHLYCWPCLYRWILNHNQCPVCKAGVTQENIIPVYGRGSKSIDPRKQEVPLGDGVPDRPRGQRPEPISRRRHTVGVDGMQEVGFSPMIGFFPSLFGLQFVSFSYFLVLIVLNSSMPLTHCQTQSIHPLKLMHSSVFSKSSCLGFS